MKRATFALLVAGAFMAGIPAYAHHSFAATYFEDKTITVEGTLVQFMFRNPIRSFISKPRTILARWKPGPWNGVAAAN
jgi:hypothetical protein